MPTVRGAPASSVAKMPGWPSVGILVTLAEAGVAQHAHGQVAAFVHAAVLGGDRGLANPLLQALHRFVVALLDFLLNGGKIGLIGSERVTGEGKRAAPAAVA